MSCQQTSKRPLKSQVLRKLDGFLLTRQWQDHTYLNLTFWIHTDEDPVHTDWTHIAREFQQELYRRFFDNEPCSEKP